MVLGSYEFATATNAGIVSGGGWLGAAPIEVSLLRTCLCAVAEMVLASYELATATNAGIVSGGGWLGAAPIEESLLRVFGFGHLIMEAS